MLYNEIEQPESEASSRLIRVTFLCLNTVLISEVRCSVQSFNKGYISLLKCCSDKRSAL